MQGLRVGSGLLRHLGVDQFRLRVGEERGAAVVAEFHREMMVEENDILDASFAQYGFDFARRIGRFILGALLLVLGLRNLVGAF